MADSFVIGYLSSGEASQIARGISIVEGKLNESNQFQPEDAVQIFPLLIPLLMHIHYKVRKNAFYLFLSILNRFSDYLDSTSDSVPNCIASLICVDEEIAECAHQALEFIFDLDDPKYWWPYCEKVLFNSKSTPQRIKLMFIIYSHFDEIPVIPIIKLLDDPIFTIQKMAYSMLQFNDQDKIQTKLEKYRTLLGMDNNPYELDMTQRQLERYRQMQETIKAQKAQKTPAQAVRRTRRTRVSDNLLESRRQAAEETIQDEMVIQGEKAMQSANDHKVHSRFVSKVYNSSPIGKHTKGSYTSYDNYHLSPNLTLNPQLNIDPNPTLIQNPNYNNYPNEMDEQDYNYDPYYGANQQNFNSNSNNRNSQQFQSYNQSPNRNGFNNNNNNYDNSNSRSRNSFGINNQNQSRSPQQADRFYASPGQSRRLNSSSPARENQDRRYPAGWNQPQQQRNNNNFNNGYGTNPNNNSLFNRSNNNKNNNMNNNSLFNRSNNNNANNNGFSNRSNSNANNNYGNNANNNGLFSRSSNNQNNSGSFNRSGNNTNNSNNNGLFNRSNNANSNNDGLFNRSSGNNNNNSNSNGLFSRSNNNRSNSPNNMNNRYNNSQNLRNSGGNMNNGYDDQSNRSNNMNMNNRFNDNQNNRNYMSNRFSDNQSNRSNNMNNRFNNDLNNQNNPNATGNGLFNRSSANRSNSPINMNNQNSRMGSSMGNRNSGNMGNGSNNFMNNGYNNNNQNYRNGGNMNNNNNFMNNGYNYNNQNYRNGSNMNRFNDNQNYGPNNNNNNNYDNYGDMDGGSVTTESMFDQMYPINQNSNGLFDRDSLYEGIMQQLGNQGFDSNESQNHRSRKVSGNGDASQTIGNGSPSKSGDPLPFELVDLKDKNWEYRRDYLEMVHKTLSSKQKHYNYRHDYLMDCVMDAAKPCNKRVAVALSKVIADIILEEPGVIEPFLDEITNFMVQSVSQFNSIYQVPSRPENSPKTATKSSNVSTTSSTVTTPRASKSDTKASATSSAMNSPRTKTKTTATTTITPTPTKSNKTPTKKSTKKSFKKRHESEEEEEVEKTTTKTEEEEEKPESVAEDSLSKKSTSTKSATPSKNSRVFNIPTSPSKTARVVLVSKTPNSTKSATKSKSGSQTGTKENKGSSSAKKKSLELPSNSNLFTVSERLSTFDSSAFDDLIDAIILEVNPSKLINSMLDYPNRTIAHVELLIQKLYRRRPNLTLCRNDLERLLTFLVCDAYPLAYKLGTIGNKKSQPAYLDAIIYLLHKTSRNQPKIYASITSLQNHAGMVEILSKFLPEEEKVEVGDKTDTLNTNNNYNASNSLFNNNTNSRSTYRNTTYNNQENDLNLPPMLIVLRELKKSDDCSIDLLADCFDNVDFISLKHVMKLFLRFLALLSRLSDKKIQDNESDLRRICFSHFNYTDLLSILSLKNVEPEILIGLSKYVWFAPKEILKGADVYYENMYRLFAKSTGQERNAIIIVASCIQKATGKSILDIPSMADPHQKVIEKLLSQYENQDSE